MLSRADKSGLTFLWIVEFEYPSRDHHGNHLRFFNLSRELIRLGHRVVFAALFLPEYRPQSIEWFSAKCATGEVSDFLELTLPSTRLRRRMAALALHPGLGDLILRPVRRPLTETVSQAIARHQADIILVSNRKFHFLINEPTVKTPVILDFGDCESLYRFRALKNTLRNKQLVGGLRQLRALIETAVRERYYGRRSAANITVSPVDQRALDRLTGKRGRNVLLLNGVSTPPLDPAVCKQPHRLIFSGNMDFPPNFEAALWFIDRVLPSLVRTIPDIQFVVAGANPIPALRERSGPNVVVTGFVPNIHTEIAASALYVAPLITGGGFKNKVVEALINRTYVVATPMAIEFLDPQVRQLILVRSDANEMGLAIREALEHPERYAGQLDQLYRFVQANFSWSARAEQMVAYAEAAGAEAPRAHGAPSLLAG